MLLLSCADAAVDVGGYWSEGNFDRHPVGSPVDRPCTVWALLALELVDFVADRDPFDDPVHHILEQSGHLGTAGETNASAKLARFVDPHLDRATDLAVHRVRIMTVQKRKPLICAVHSNGGCFADQHFVVVFVPAEARNHFSVAQTTSTSRASWSMVVGCTSARPYSTPMVRLFVSCFAIAIFFLDDRSGGIHAVNGNTQLGQPVDVLFIFFEKLLGFAPHLSDRLADRRKTGLDPIDLCGGLALRIELLNARCRPVGGYISGQLSLDHTRADKPIPHGGHKSAVRS